MICRRCKKEFDPSMQDPSFEMIEALQYFVGNSIDEYCESCLYDLSEQIDIVICHFENEEI